MPWNVAENEPNYDGVDHPNGEVLNDAAYDLLDDYLDEGKNDARLCRFNEAGNGYYIYVEWNLDQG